jgi:hypothetical protein
LAGAKKSGLEHWDVRLGRLLPYIRLGETAVSAGCCRVVSVSQADLRERLPHKRQMGVDIMTGRYLDKLHLVRVSLGILPTGGDGHDLILRAVNDGDGGWWWRWGLRHKPGQILARLRKS